MFSATELGHERIPKMSSFVRTWDFFALVALAAQLVLALSLRATAWPEVTTPGYLWSRGMLLYRDIKFQHGPGTMGTLALAFLAFGVHTWVVRAYATIWPLIAHFFVLRETRPFSLIVRLLASAFFLVQFFSLDGNAVWPTVVMSAWAIPIAAALSRRRMWSAGLLIGAAILFKQTAAYVLLVAVFWLLAHKRLRDAWQLWVAACLPYAVTLSVFAILGAGPEMLRWTLEVPLTIHPEGVTFRPSVFDLSVLIFAFLPTVGDALLEREGEYEIESRWLVLVALGFALVSYPRWGLTHTIPSVPCLAVGVARFLRRSATVPWLRRAVFAFVITFVGARALVLANGNDFDGKILFWNAEPAFDRLVARLRSFPPDARVHSLLWENVLPRSGHLPPGRLYVNPFFSWFFPVDHIGERIRTAAKSPGTVVVGYPSSTPGEERIGPYALFQVPENPK